MLEAHYKKRHGMELNLPFMCKDCDVSFILEEALIYHQKREHSHEISTYKCDECQTEFFSHGYKTVHDMMYHNLSKSEMILCKYCPEIRQSIDEILEHHWTYHEMQKLPFFQCEMCDFYSTRRMQAVNHVKNEHNMDEYRPYKCKQYVKYYDYADYSYIFVFTSISLIRAL